MDINFLQNWPEDLWVQLEGLGIIGRSMVSGHFRNVCLENDWSSISLMLLVPAWIGGEGIKRSGFSLISPAVDNVSRAQAALAWLGVAVLTCPFPVAVHQLEEALEPVEPLRAIVFGSERSAKEFQVSVFDNGKETAWAMVGEPLVEDGRLSVEFTAPQGFSGRRAWLLLRFEGGGSCPLGVSIVEGQCLKFDVDLSSAIATTLRKGLLKLRKGRSPASLFFIRLEPVEERANG